VNATDTDNETILTASQKSIETFKKLFDDEKAIFSRQAGEDPSLAIKFSELVLGRQYVYEAWLQVGNYIDRHGGINARNAVTYCLASLKHDLDFSIDKRNFSSVLEHAQHGCYQRALKYVIEQIEELLKVCD
jgi:hypothetical protein